MNLATLIFGQVAFMVNYYADLYMEQDRAAMVSQPNFSNNFNLPIAETFDFIIVGGGTAGCLVANRLAKANFKVLLLEAGGTPPPPTFVPGNAPQFSKFDKIIFDYTTVEQSLPHADRLRSLKVRIGKVLGGTSTLNYMFFNRGSPHDYDNWANITGDDSWNYANLLPHFKSVESYAGQHSSDQHGYNGAISISTQSFVPGSQLFLNAGSELGYASGVDPNGPQKLSFTAIDVNKRSGQRVSSYEAFINRAGNTPNLEIRRYSLVQEIVIDQDTKVVLGVRYNRHGFPQLAYATKEVIVSAGSFGSPKLLLKSGIGPADELRALGITPIMDLPVGKNLQDHPIIPLQINLLDSTPIYKPDYNLTASSVQEFLNGAGGPLTSVGGLSSQAFLASSVAGNEGYPDWSDIQLAVYSMDRQILPTPTSIADNVIYCFAYLGRQKSSGSVKLNPVDIDGAPLIDLNFLSDETDVQIFMEGIQMALKVFENTTVFANAGARYPTESLEACKQFLFRSDDYWKCYISNTVDSGSHPTGTCAMGKSSDPSAVVDPKLRVLGIQNLRVIDASIMPVITNTNIQAAVYVIAEKGAADILAEHGVAHL